MPPTDGRAGGKGTGSLRARRCVRHSAREAAGRCAQCGQFFCRECVVDHEGRLVCATCLAALAAGAKKKSGRARNWRPLLDVASLAVAVLVALFCFHFFGSMLLKIPASVHEGTVWREIEGGGAP